MHQTIEDTHTRKEEDTRAPEERLSYSIREASNLTSLSRWTIHGLICDGQLKASKVRKRVLIHADSLKALIAGGAS